MSDLQMSPPWISYARKIEVLFGRDPEIKVDYNNDDVHLFLRVDNPTKADAISKLLPETKEFGNVTLGISVIPSNNEESKVSTFRKAFAGNPIVSYIEETQPMPFSTPMCYMIFENEVIQYYDDRLDDPYGLESTLTEDIARDVFENTDNVVFSTDVPANTNDKVIKEWP